MNDREAKRPPRELDWPNTVRTREELDEALEEGLNSGVSERTTEEIFESAIARAKNAKL